MDISPLQKIVNQVIELIANEINKEDNKQQLQSRVVHPLLSMLYKELYPYIAFVLISMIIILLLSIIILGLLIISYLRTRRY
jgi:hypothetical protein